MAGLQRRTFNALVLAGVVGSGRAARAADGEIAITYYGTSMYGMPYTLAAEHSDFKAAGIETPGFLTGQGGGSVVRTALAATIPYGEVATSAAIAAIKQGLPITIVNSCVGTVGDILWIARKDDPRPLNAKTLDGLVIGYSSPKGGSDMIVSEILRVTGAKATKRPVGGVSASLTALREKAVDITWTQEPIWSGIKDQYRLVFNSSDFIPRISQTVGIVRNDYLKTHPDTVRAIIEARRKGVDFLYAQPEQSAGILGKSYKMDPKIVLDVIQTVATIKGVNYWSRGNIDYEGLKISLKTLQAVGAVDDKPVDWKSVVSESFLPNDLRSN
jgi:NitT/TauT family transport system substrate-binding protein